MIFRNNGRTFEIDKHPDKCPFCHELTKPSRKGGNLNLSEDYISNIILEILFKCSNNDCQKLFIGYYIRIGENEYNLERLSKGNYKIEKFSQLINTISPKFIEIYNQAYIAEQEKLYEVCGMGYRKAIEFLVKDYCKIIHEDNQNNIENLRLSKVISNYIENQDIKDIAERAVWLGNDETHYLRKWDNHNLSDMKNLIKAIIKGIELKSTHVNIISQMPKE